MVIRYFKLGAGQFLRDFRREFHLKKAMAHRKAVLEKKMRAEEKSRKVEISDLENDRSSNKSTSHLRLVALAVQIKEDGFVRLYKKAELRQLCEAYMGSVVAKWNERRIAKELLQKLAICDKMPCHQSLSRYVVEELPPTTDARKQMPVLRLRRV